MAADRLPPSANLSDDSDRHDEEFEEEEGDERFAADIMNRKIMNYDTESDSDENEEADEDEEVEDEKTMSTVRGELDYGSDDDSGKTVRSPSPSDFIVKENSKGKKRAAEIEPVKVKKSKKDKKKNGEKENGVTSVAVEDTVVVEDKMKRLSGQRIWGPEDELMIVKGMMDYKEEKGVAFNSNLDAFYQFIKGQLNAVVDKSQLVNKIRKLKEKFRDNVAKEGNSGELVFLKSHDKEVYKYSQQVWGGKAVARSKSKSNKEKEVVADAPPVMEVDNVFVLPVPDLELSKKEMNGESVKSASQVTKSVKNSKVADKIEADVEMKDSIIPMPLMIEGLIFEKGLESVEKSKLDALNDKWNKYQMDAAELYVRRVGLIKEQTELILDAMKSNM